MPNLGDYNPYQNMDSWYGVPDYGGAYNSYMSMQQQHLSLGRLVSMVREIQDGMGRQPLGNNAVNVSAPTQMEIPAQIAASIMNTQNRLLSMPRQRWAESGGYNLPDTAHDPNAPADNVQRTGFGGSGGGTGGGFGTGGSFGPTYSAPQLGSYNPGGGSQQSGGTALPKTGTLSGPQGGTGLNALYKPSMGGLTNLFKY
jgi:hypothetical protein